MDKITQHHSTLKSHSSKGMDLLHPFTAVQTADLRLGKLHVFILMHLLQKVFSDAEIFIAIRHSCLCLINVKME